MKILVTGAAGYIGSVVTALLVEQGHSVVALDNLSQGHRAAVHPGAHFVMVDLRDRGALDELFRVSNFEGVIHLAGETLVTKSMSDPAVYFEQNVVNGLNLLQTMLAHRVLRVIFSSTAAVYGEPRAVPLLEDDLLQPVNAYGESKLIFETMLRWYQRAYGMRHATFRYFNAAGATEAYGEHHHPESHLIPLVLAVALGQRDHITIFGADYDTRDGTCVRDYVHVTDIARAHLAALERLEELTNATFNIGNSEGFSVMQVIETARQVTGAPIPARFAARRPGDPAKLVASSERLRTRLNFEPAVPALETIIASAWEWRKKNPFGYGTD